MRIAHVLDYYQPQLGYQEYYLAKEQKRMGHEVHVVTSERYFPFSSYSSSVGAVLGKRKVRAGNFEEEGVWVHRLPCFFEYKRSGVVIMKNLKKTLGEIKPELVQEHEVFSITPFMVASYKESLDYALVYDTHASTFNTNLTDTLPKLIYHFFFQKWMMPVIRNNADAIIAVGESERELICQEFGLRDEQIPIIPLGADTDLFKFNEKERQKVRQSLKITDNEVLLIHAGKLAPNKDVEVLLRGVAPVMRRNKLVRLLIVGGGARSYMDRLTRIIQEGNISNNVILRDFVNHGKLPKLYSAADIGIWPGNLTNTTQEGMATTLPVILPEVVSEHQTSEHLLSNNNGFSFPRGNPEVLSRCIATLVGDEKLRRKMGLRSRQLVEKKFSWKSISRRFCEAYTASLRKNRLAEES